MNRLVWAAAALVLIGTAAAWGDAPLVDCLCKAGGGSGPRFYAYQVDAVSFPMMEFLVGANDLDAGRYLNVLSQPGWSFAVEAEGMSHAHGLFTPHGGDSPGPCYCLTAGRVHWWTDDPALAVQLFVFGFDYYGVPEDVGWRLECRREGPPPEYYTFEPNWDAAVGLGGGPLHGPSRYAPLGDLTCDGKLDAFDIDPFVLALTDPKAYIEQHDGDPYPYCPLLLADVNGDGAIDAFDVDPFVELLAGG